MKRLLFLPALLLFVLVSTPALSLTLSLEPTDQNIPLGGTAFIDLNISGLTAGGPDSLGAFSLDITFDETILTFDTISFGTYLGDPNAFEASAYFDDSTPGSVYLEEGSWLFDWELDPLQPASFTLATLAFTGTGIGSGVVAMENVVLSDAFGIVLHDPVLNNAEVSPVPEPATALIIGTGLVAFIGFGRKRLFKR